MLKRKRTLFQSELLSKFACVPVFCLTSLQLPFTVAFQIGTKFIPMCSTLWPLLHYSPADMEFDEFLWDSYKKANQIFCDAIVQCFQEGDIIWVHDYHLMLLPRMLREALGPHVKIGFFLHTPFPSSEVFG